MILKQTITPPQFKGYLKIMTEIYTLVDSNRRIDEYIKLRLGRRTKMQFPLAKLIGAKGTLKLQAHKGFIITLHDHRNAPAR